MREMVEVAKFGLTEVDMRGIGKMIRQMARVD